jgi:hypothetical protein
VLVAGSSFPRWPRPKQAGTQRVLDGSRLELTTAALRADIFAPQCLR